MSGATGSAAWYARSADAGSGKLTAYATGDFPDGLVVPIEELAGRDLASMPSLWHARFDPATGRLLHVSVVGRGAGLWYVDMPEPDAAPPAATLVAFETTHFPPGRVIDSSMFTPLPIGTDEQVGAVRWWPGTGQVHQVYVHPAQRRRGIGTALLYAASAHLVAGGASSRLWGSGDRTDLGEVLVNSLPHPQRFPPRRRVLPPMTPAAQTVGIPERNLFPSH